MVREEVLDTLGKTIRFYRKKAEMTQEQLAEKIYTKKSVIFRRLRMISVP